MRVGRLGIVTITSTPARPRVTAMARGKPGHRDARRTLRRRRRPAALLARPGHPCRGRRLAAAPHPRPRRHSDQPAGRRRHALGQSHRGCDRPRPAAAEPASRGARAAARSAHGRFPARCRDRWRTRTATAPPSGAPAEPAAAPPARRRSRTAWRYRLGRAQGRRAHLRLACAGAGGGVPARAGVLWAAFDTERRRDARPRPADAGGGSPPGSSPCRRRASDGATLFRFRLGPRARAEAVQDGRTWRIRLTPVAGRTRPALGMVRDQEAGAPARARRQPARSTSPTRTPASGWARSWPRAAACASRSRSAWSTSSCCRPRRGWPGLPLADGITVAADAGGFTLTRDGGLRLSDRASARRIAAAARRRSRRHSSASPALAGTDPAEPPAGAAGAGRPHRRAQPMPQALARLDQVRLLLADGLGPEARATLERRLPRSLPGRGPGGDRAQPRPPWPPPRPRWKASTAGRWASCSTRARRRPRGGAVAGLRRRRRRPARRSPRASGSGAAGARPTTRCRCA